MHYYPSRNADLELTGSSDGALFKLGAYGHLGTQLWDFHRGEDAIFLFLFYACSILTVSGGQLIE